VLKPGGKLRTSVPNFTTLCEKYCYISDVHLVIGALSGGQDYLYNIHYNHYNVFDFALLRGNLENTGFVSVRECDWRSVEHADVDDYSQAYVPHMDKTSGVLVSLNVERGKGRD
jgi:hypothetical protein